MGLLSEVLRTLSFQRSMCWRMAEMEFAPGIGGVVASSGVILARSSASDGPYQAPLMVAA